MMWQDLRLPAGKLRQLRDAWGMSAPEQVVQLAWGAPKILSNVLDDDEVVAIRKANPKPPGNSYDSSEFTMGAHFGAPGKDVSTSNDFEAKRADLIERIRRASSDKLRDRLQGRLVDLYSNVEH